MSNPKTPDVRQFLFMGVQLETIDRGRVYGCSEPMTESELADLAKWAAERDACLASLPAGSPRGSLTLTGGGCCVCGKCLVELRCAEEVAP